MTEFLEFSKVNTILAPLTNPNNTKMKKLFVFGAAIAFMATFASCKKDHTCTCTTTSDDGMGGTSSASISGTINDTKKNAEEKCEEGNATTDVGGFTSTTTCKLD